MPDQPDPVAPADGLGRSSAATPTFSLPGPAPVPASQHPGPPGWPAPPPVRPQPAGSVGPPARSRLPALVTAAVLALVATVVVAGTLLARHADTHVAPRPDPAAPASRAVPLEPDPGSIDFATSYGAGRLSVLEHAWSAGSDGSHLRLRVELVCTRGSVEHAPQYFSLFDDQGRLVERSPAADEAHPVPLGSIRAGERIRGDVSFDLPRGAVTLVLSDDLSSVTAVRIAG